MAQNKIFTVILINLLISVLISSFELKRLNPNVSFKTDENVLFKELGVINEQSRLMDTSEFEEDGWEGDIVTSFAMRGFLNIITGIRIFQTNNTRGNAIIDGGGISFNYVEFQFFGGGIGEGYAFLIECYETPGVTLEPTESTVQQTTTSLPITSSEMPKTTSQPVTSESTIGIITESSVMTFS